MASGLAKEAGDTSTVGSHGTCSDRRYGKNKHSYGDLSTEDRVSSKEPILWMWIGEKIGVAMHMEDLDIWQEIVETEE